jgi:hypothetical protein
VTVARGGTRAGPRTAEGGRRPRAGRNAGCGDHRRIRDRGVGVSLLRRDYSALSESRA